MSVPQKTEVYTAFAELLHTRITEIQAKLEDLRDISAQETKSSAGDKYETTRALLQIEQDNLSLQLNEAKKDRMVFERINISVEHKIIGIGSLVQTDKGWFFISIALGRVILEGNMIYALSIHSPLGIAMAGSVEGAEIEYNKTVYKIISVA